MEQQLSVTSTAQAIWLEPPVQGGVRQLEATYDHRSIALH